MRRILYTAAVLCLSLLAVQCNKDIDEPQEVDSQIAGSELGAGYMELTADGMVHMCIGVSGGGDASTRTTIAGSSASGARAVSWNAGDKIYVVAGTTGGCLGSLSAKTSGTSVAFEGTIDSWTGTQTLHYYYVGSSKSIDKGATSYSYSIASQDGTLSGIAENFQLMHASAGNMTAGGKALPDLTMSNLMAIGRYDLTTHSLFSGTTLTMSGAYNKATLNLLDGTFSFNEADKGITLSGIGADYYIVMLPGSQTVTFTDSKTSCSYLQAKDITAGNLYTDNGGAIPVLFDYVEGKGTQTTSYGPGVIIDGIIWAPVNCGIGYASANPNGLLYQWDRIYGQAYSDGTYSNLVSTRPTLGAANTSVNMDNHYTGGGSADWYMGATANDTWDNNPCPTGWRVPTKAELESLLSLTSEWNSTKKGRVFYANSSKAGSSLFLPAAGTRSGSGSRNGESGIEGSYYCGNSSSSTHANHLAFSESIAPSSLNSDGKFDARSVRCVYGPVEMPGLFTINSSGTQVRFSKGNLYYDGSESDWKFESNQYDYRTMGGSYSCINGVKSDTGTPADDWGLFGWVGASSTTLTGSLTKYGMSTSKTHSDYGTSASDALKADWADISTLPQVTGRKWKTLTGGEKGEGEWWYLTFTRKVIVDGESKTSYGYGCVNGVNGLIILPDSWDGSVCSGFVYGTIDAKESYSSNKFDETTTPTWSEMESAGCVFLPAVGDRKGTSMDNVTQYGLYWSSTPQNSQRAYCLYIEEESASFIGLRPDNSYYRYTGRSVRLVSYAE